MKICIIGGSGFIGSRLCRRLSKVRGLSFTILDKVRSSEFPNCWYYCDVRDIDTLRNSFCDDFDIVVNLAAEHKDNVSPSTLYYDVNVQGQRNIIKVMDEFGINKLVFTSSVAVYGFVDNDTCESGIINPFNDYGKSKYMAEQVANEWFDDSKQFSVVRPTVVFGEGNRGNLYNLLRQIASGKFLMIGNGLNQKSMAYVENVAGFIEHLIFEGVGHQVFNYIDKPDFNMNELVLVINEALGKKTNIIRVPFSLGLFAGYFFDLLSKLFNKDLIISSIRVKKFCARTQFKTSTNYLNFKPPVSLTDGLSKTVINEFLNK